MKRLILGKKPLFVLAFCMFFAILLSACGSGNTNSSVQSTVYTPTSSSPSDNNVSVINSTDSNTTSAAKITIDGSTSLQPLVKAASTAFMKNNSNISITVNGGGSSVGLKDVISETVDIGNSDVYSNDVITDETDKDLIDHKVCVVGIAALINSKNKVNNITSNQLIGIFTGKITNWKDVGGDDQKIDIINRTKGSGTRIAFKNNALGGQEEINGTASKDASGDVVTAIKDDVTAISYISLSYVAYDESIKPLNLNGIEPTKGNICSGQYPVWTYEHMYTKGKPSDQVQQFLDFMVSSDMTQQVSDLGYISLSDMKVSK